MQGQNTSYTAQEIINRLAPSVAALDLPAGYSVELGGEIEEAAESNAALSTYMPLAFLAMLMLFVWQFNSFRKLGVILATIPFTLIGVVLALKLTGTPFSFMATFGVLALFGIIVNNAVLLLERIDQGLAEGLPRHEALVGAAIQRLRPIVMTKVTCISGLVPLMLLRTIMERDGDRDDRWAGTRNAGDVGLDSAALRSPVWNQANWAVEPECRHRAWRSLMSLASRRVLRILRIRMHPRFMRMSR